MKLSRLSETKASKAVGRHWEQNVKPSIHYLKKSKDPLRAWSARDLVMAFALDAKYLAKYIIKKFDLQEDDLEDLVQTGLLRAFEKIQELQSEDEVLSGPQLYTYVKRGIYDWMIQGGGGGEDWRSTTRKDLRASKIASKRQEGPWLGSDKEMVRSRVGKSTPSLPPRPSRGSSSLVLEPAKAVGLLRKLEDTRKNLWDLEAREELAYAVDGITKERTRDIMRRFLGVMGKPPIHARELAPEFGISPQAIGSHIKKGMLELKSVLADL